MDKVVFTIVTIFNKLQLNIDTVDDKKLCHRKIYILQYLGINLGYNFLWWNGPYSPNLSDFIYLDLDNNPGYLKIKEVKLNNKTEQLINKVIFLSAIPKEFIENSNYTELDWYTLLSSILYTKDTLNVKTNLAKKVSELLEDYTEDKVEVAIKFLKDMKVLEG